MCCTKPYWQNFFVRVSHHFGVDVKLVPSSIVRKGCRESGEVKCGIPKVLAFVLQPVHEPDRHEIARDMVIRELVL